MARGTPGSYRGQSRTWLHVQGGSALVEETVARQRRCPLSLLEAAVARQRRGAWSLLEEAVARQRGQPLSLMLEEAVSLLEEAVALDRRLTIRRGG